MFEVPESDITCVRVDEDVINEKKPIEYIRAPKQQDDSANMNFSDSSKQQGTTEVDKAKNYA